MPRIKTSISLPEDLLRCTDPESPEDLLKCIERADLNRSALIERATRAYLARLEKARREAQARGWGPNA